jgi:FtsP/CotA-like multicopper oxidase with cupredoxin domain
LGWLALDLVNAGSTTKLSVSLDSHSMFVYAADGLYVEMQEVKVSCPHLCVILSRKAN